ncbi:hypothetical protein [Anaeromyxobacter diazotrophicus]|uniref:Uncharacterized protein n=1 Tax=Anaeromyxobacter diazotrophicus TaxID=2590199 RepID=A0A7I9VIA8_9BACT|nr:hypothetical protein [Anaeromyxobacter diazotrophicus]GEJ56146.1 hypothetical protein AMYX_08870 [Anaeromyxobacter diazotrophicus]
MTNTAPRAPRSSALFDALEARWESALARRVVADGLVLVFLASLAHVELGRRGLLPPALAPAHPRNHFHAVQVAFYLLLGYEVVGLVFGLARSVANAAGKQFEIFSLILLRQSFEAFGDLHEPIVWGEVRGTVLEMLSDCAGALVIFVLLGLYYRLQRHQPLSPDAKDRQSFIHAKKAVALTLLALFLGGMGWAALSAVVLRRPPPAFFESLYTLLIFADILVVLISARYSSTYRVVFRNSGVAVSTVLLRLALSAPVFLNALLGAVAVAFALALTVAYNLFAAGEVERPPAPALAPGSLAP